MKTPRKNNARKQNITTWIRQRISPFCYGVRTNFGNPGHCNRNDDVLNCFRLLRAGGWGRLSRLSKADMDDHFAGRKTFYFTADGRSATDEVLINIDIDCHFSGSLDGALAFARHLRSKFFPDLYFEASTNGRGVHGYMVVLKGDLGDEGLNTLLKSLDRWLKFQLSRGKWDVENVEAKGHAPEFTWGRDKYELRTYKSGQLAKLPREALSRAEELRGTTRLTIDQLRRLRVPDPADVPDDSVVSKAGRRQGPRLVVVEKADKNRTGSISGHHFGADELANLKGTYLSLAGELLGETRLVATGRKVVTKEDIAIFLMLLNFFTKNMNGDGSLPTARWREMWGALSEGGDVDRGWCHHRFAVIRNYLSDQDLLSWEDVDFVSGVFGVDGRFIPGNAAKWRASEELMDRISSGSREISTGSQEKEEERTILYGCNGQTASQGQPLEFEDNAIQGSKKPEEQRTQDNRDDKGILHGSISFETQAPTTTNGQSPFYLNLVERLRSQMPSPRPRFKGYALQRLRMAA